LRKLAALYHNEMIKLTRKTSILVMLAVMLVGMVGYAGLIKITTLGWDMLDEPGDAVSDQALMRQELSSLQQELAGANSQYEQAGETEKIELAGWIYNLKDRIAQIDLALQWGVSLYSDQTWRLQALDWHLALKSEWRQLAAIPEDQKPTAARARAVQIEQLMTAYDRAVTAQDFSAYLAARALQISADETIPAGIRQIQLNNLLRWQIADPLGGLENPERSAQIMLVLEQIEAIETTLYTNLDQSQSWLPRPLTPAGRTRLQTALTLLLYRLDTDQLPTGYTESAAWYGLDGSFSFGFFMVALIVMILAGGSIASEIATGSIKSLIIAPARRWKIFTAKLLSLITVMIGSALLLYGVGLITHGLFWGFDRPAYISVAHGVVFKMPFALHRLLVVLLTCVDILVYLVFALMLSTTVRNTSAAVGVTLAIYFGSSVIQSLLSWLGPADWIRFMPFMNFGLAGRILPDMNLDLPAMAYNALETGAQPSPLFSGLYLACLLFCLLLTAYDSFCRRDIL
jgi:ABC-type transport system involved in multi-copper enzyme maturation permease subunit